MRSVTPTIVGSCGPRSTPWLSGYGARDLAQMSVPRMMKPWAWRIAVTVVSAATWPIPGFGSMTRARRPPASRTRQSSEMTSLMKWV